MVVLKNRMDYGSLYSLMLSRRSVRKFKNKKVPRELIEKIVAAGITAPSSFNKQPWKFVVLEDPEKKKILREIYADARKKQGLYEQDTSFVEIAVPIILVCESEDKGLLYSCAMAAQNMNLAAISLGLGSLQAIAATTQEEDRERIAELIGEKKGFVMLVLFYGYPDEEPQKKPKKALGEVMEFI
ncbi:MAG: nitroreductase family protein [archaeon]|nr:nitroreductase family protein [archaeon]